MRVVLAFVLLCLLIQAKKNIDPKHCEVCIKVYDEIKAKAWENGKPSITDAQDTISSVCRKYQRGSTQKKLCGEILELKGNMAKSILVKGMDAKYGCNKLSSNNKEVCDMRFPEEYAKDTNFKKLRMKQLKRIIANNNLDCKNCFEKADFVRVVENFYAKK